MTDSFDPIEYLSYVRRHGRFCALAVAAAALAAAGAAWMLPKQYTATAMLVIEPPAVNDPRAGTAVSSIYLESLKAYEEFAASDSLFAKACEEFGLLTRPGAASIEALKRRVLKVDKLKDTKLLRIRVTMKDAALAHRLAEYLGRETVALNRSIAREADTALLDDTRTQLAGAEAKLEEAREAYGRVTEGGNERVWNEELLTLADLEGRTRVELLSAQARLAELAARGESEELAAERARVAELTAALAGLDREMGETSAKLAGLRGRQDRAAAAVRTEEQVYEAWSRRTTELAASNGSRTESLRMVDPGIVPQRPSFPNLPLFLAVAVVLSSLASVGGVSLRFGFEQQRLRRERPETAAEPTEIRVARGGR